MYDWRVVEELRLLAGLAAMVMGGHDGQGVKGRIDRLGV